MIAPFDFINNPQIDSFSFLTSKLVNSGILKSCGFYKKNETTAHNIEARTESSESECFKLSSVGTDDSKTKLKVGRPVEYSAFFILKLLLTYTFTGAATLGAFFKLPISKAVALQKSTVYNFLGSPTHNWKKLLLKMSFKAVKLIQETEPLDNFSAFICDDSNIHRRRAKHVELSARNFDHVEGKNTKGFLLLPVSWTNTNTTIPCNMALVSSSKQKNVIMAAKSDVDKRTVGGKRRAQAVKSKNEIVLELVDECIHEGITAEYFMTDSWFTCNNQLVLEIARRGLYYIGMDKNFTQSYLYEDKAYSLNMLRQFAVRDSSCSNSDILGHTLIAVPPTKQKAKLMTEDEYRKSCIPAKIVWLIARGSKEKVLAILCTDLSLSDEEVVRRYSARFNIEFGFFHMKHFLNLERGSRATNYDSVFAHTAMSCMQLVIMTLLKLFNEDHKTIGELYHETTDAIRVKPLADVITRIVTMVTELPSLAIDRKYIVKGKEKEFSRFILEKLQKILSDVSLYVADFILHTIENVKKLYSRYDPPQKA